MPSQIVMKARELAMAAPSAAVSLPDGDADEWPKTMMHPLSHSPALSPRTVKVPVQLHPRYIGGNGVDVLADTCAAELAPIRDGARGAVAPACGFGLPRPERAWSPWAYRGWRGETAEVYGGSSVMAARRRLS
jgi:hypothetical protein